VNLHSVSSIGNAWERAFATYAGEYSPYPSAQVNPNFSDELRKWRQAISIV